MDYQDYLKNLVAGLVSTPESIRVDMKKDDMGILLTLHVHASDMGVVVGRMGHTAQAIRDIMRAVGMKHRARMNLKIAEPSEV